MGLRISFSKQAKTTGPTRACRDGQLQRGHRRPICAHTRSSVFTNAATDRPTERAYRQTNKQTDRQKDRRKTDIQTADKPTDNRLSLTTKYR